MGLPQTDVIRPKFAVLNPRFTCSLPAYQTASGAVDMMAHIMERYFTNTPDVGLTDRLCEALLKTVLDAAPKAIADPNDYAARADLMWAGMLAHNNSCGVGREQDWASHQIEHELSAFYDCAHGAGLAVILPAWMEYVLPHDPVRLAQFAVRVFGCEMNFADPEATARQGIEKLCLFFHSLGMPITFDELGAKAKDIPDMVAHRAEKPGGFPFGGFVKIQPADMEAILRLAAGEPVTVAPPGAIPGRGFTISSSPELPGTHVEGAAEGPQEGGILLKSGLLRRLHHRHAGADQLPGPQQPLLADVLVDRVAGDGLEPVHQIVPADEKPLGEGTHRQLLTQMVRMYRSTSSILGSTR